MKKFLFLLVVFSLALPCAAGKATSAQGNSLSFRKHIVTDRNGFGYEAFRLLVPKGWHFRGGVSWDYNRFPPEAGTAFTITSPDGNSVFEQSRHLNLFWSEDRTLQYSYAQGGAEIVQPMGAAEFIKNFYIPRSRANASGLKVVQNQSLPALAQQTRDMAQFQLNVFGQISPFQFQYELRADAARCKLEYSERGKRIVEDVTVAVTYMISYTPSMYGTITGVTWIPIATSFKAPATEINEKIKIFKIVMDSRKDNPVWGENVLKLSAMITRDQLRHQQAIFNRMQQLSRTQSEIGDMIMDSYQKRNQAYDRIFDNYSQSIRGVDSYTDPINNWKVEVPTGYDNAWTNGSDYVISEDPGFNPNIGSTQDWQQMTRQR
jgi:hypothetical protein